MTGTKNYRATKVAPDPLDYFLKEDAAHAYIRVADVVLRANQKTTDVFSHLIRFGTNSHWSHTALMYLLSDPHQGFDNTFLVEAMTTGIRVASWRNEVTPFSQFTVGIRRIPLDWYVETPQEIASHNPHDPEDTHGIAYLRHVRGMAVDQINNLYDQDVIDELTALYVKRLADYYHIGTLSEVSNNVAQWFAKRDEQHSADSSVTRFICSGLVQYSFFSALRRRIMNALASSDVAAHDAAMQNLSNLARIIFRHDQDGVIPDYIQQIQTGKLKLGDDLPQRVVNFLKTTTPADVNLSQNLVWRYIIQAGAVWQIDEAPADYVPHSQEEQAVLDLMKPIRPE